MPPRSIRSHSNSFSHSHRNATLHSDSDADTDSASGEYATFVAPRFKSALPHHLASLRARLTPLYHVEELLISQLVPPSEDAPFLPERYPPNTGVMGGYANGHGAGNGHANGSRHSGHVRADSTGEVFVRPGMGWKRAMAVRTEMQTCGVPNGSGPGYGGQEVTEEVQKVLVQCRDDIITLWNDPFVRAVLKKRKIRLEERPGL